jgi:hypothetical protein
MSSKKEKELWARMCECGHTYGEHSCVMPRRCLRVMTCCGKNKCKGFRLKKFALHETKDDNNVKEDGS